MTAGSVAGSQAAYRAALQQAGVILVDEIEALLDTTSFFAKAPPPRARGVAVAAVSGGACILLADQAESQGVDLPPPSAATLSRLEALIPEYGSPGNPCDMTAQVLATPQQGGAGQAQQPDYGNLSTPSVWRTNRHQAAAKVEALSSNGMDEIEIPAFLRKQAD